MARRKNWIRWIRECIWPIESPLLVGLAIAVAAVVVSLSVPGPSARHPVAMASTKSVDLVPGNPCWDDHAGVLRQLLKLNYEMGPCGTSSFGLVSDTWNPTPARGAGWPTVVVRQQIAGAPITLDSFYMDGPEPSNDWLNVNDSERTWPVATVVQAAKVLLAQVNRLRRLTFEADCINGTRTANVSTKVNGRTVRFLYSYLVANNKGQVMWPPSCPSLP